MLDDDVAAAVEQMRRERSAGLSEVVNELIRAGLRAKRHRRPYRQRTDRLGIRVDVRNTAEALELLESLPPADPWGTPPS